MPKERRHRGHKSAEKRKREREEEEKTYLLAQERDYALYNRPKHPFGILSHADERFFSEVGDEFEKSTWVDEDAKEVFLKNVFLEMKGKELAIATNGPVGQFLEMLLPHCPMSELQRIMAVFKGHVKELARHRFGSFALEKIAGYVATRINSQEPGMRDKGEDMTLQSVEQLFIDMIEVFLALCSIDSRKCSTQRCMNCLLIHLPHMSIEPFLIA